MKKRNGKTQILLGDFGLTCKVLCFESSTIEDKHNEICHLNSTKLTGGIGTALYAAPEQIVSRDYSSLVSITIFLHN